MSQIVPLILGEHLLKEGPKKDLSNGVYLIVVICRSCNVGTKRGGDVDS